MTTRRIRRFGSAVVGLMVALLAYRCAADDRTSGPPRRGPASTPGGERPPAPSEARGARDLPFAVGVNVGEVNYYTTQIAFLDLAKQGADWGLNADHRPPPVDARGYPAALPAGDAGFIANAGTGGRFVALYAGDADLHVTHGGRVVSERPGRVEMILDPGEVHFRIHRIDRNDRLRDLRIVPIEYESNHEAQLFHPRFLELLRPFRVLRFLDWARTNGSNQVRWADRPKPTDFSQGTEKGVALEYTIELCNRVQADCWFNIPHQADDEYIARYAEMVRDRLDPSLRAYVEYSNEIWNFEHGDFCQRAGERLGMPREWDTRLRYQAHRSIEIFRVFERALGRERLVRVIAGQMWDVRLRIPLEWEDAYRQTDAVAVAPYFCGDLSSDERVAETRRLDAGALARRCEGVLAQTREEIRHVRALATSLGLPLVAYEGGQHLATSGAHHQDEPLQRLLDAANRHPNMGRAYARYLEMWREEVGHPIVLYQLAGQSSFWGRWGLVEDPLAPLERAPKYRAVLDFAERR